MIFGGIMDPEKLITEMCKKKRTPPHICAGGIEEIANPEELDCLGIARLDGRFSNWAETTDYDPGVQIWTLNGEIHLDYRDKKSLHALTHGNYSGLDVDESLPLINIMLNENGYYFCHARDGSEKQKHRLRYVGTLYKKKQNGKKIIKKTN